MDKLTELQEFLAWVQDNYCESIRGNYMGVHDNKEHTVEEIVAEYLMETSTA